MAVICFLPSACLPVSWPVAFGFVYARINDCQRLTIVNADHFSPEHR